MAKTSKEKRIAEEKERLLQIFQDMDPNKLAAVNAVIGRLAFHTINIHDIEEDLLRDGWVEGYQNGEHQSGLKKSAAADVYVSLTKNLISLTKQLLDIVPAAQRKSKLTEMMTR